MFNYIKIMILKKKKQQQQRPKSLFPVTFFFFNLFLEEFWGVFYCKELAFLEGNNKPDSHGMCFSVKSHPVPLGSWGSFCQTKCRRDFQERTAALGSQGLIGKTKSLTCMNVKVTSSVMWWWLLRCYRPTEIEWKNLELFYILFFLFVSFSFKT